MKKIVFFVPSLAVGGMERVLVTYANLFARRGYDVTVFNLTSGDPAITDFFDPAVHYRERYIPVPHFLHAKPKDLLKFNFRIRTFGDWINSHSARYLAKKYLKEHFDIAVAFFGITTLKIVGGISDRDTKKIGWIHGGGRLDNYAPVKRFEDAVAVIKSLEKIICVSDGTRESVAKIYGVKDNVSVVYNPNDSALIRKLALEKDHPEKKRFTFVNASRFDDKQKGLSRLLHACKRLREEGYPFDLWLVGDGIDYEMITNLAKEYGLDNVTFFGQQKNPYKFIRNADMYVCSSYCEGFSIVMIETVILATPMLTTDVPGAGEMLEGGKYGMIVENSEEGLYTGMKAVLSDGALYQHYRQMAELRKDYLSEDKIMDEVERIIYE